MAEEFGFVRLEVDGRVRLGVERSGSRWLLSDAVPDWDPSWDLTRVLPEWDAIVDAVAAVDLDPTRVVRGERLLPAAAPSQLLQAGANYRQHVVELSIAQREEGVDRDVARRSAEERVDRRVREGSPYVFPGLVSSLAPADAQIAVPSPDTQPDWELELGVLLRGGAADLTLAEAEGSVAGYLVANDLTLRARVYRPDMPAIGTDWLRSKNLPGFTPIGPMVVPARFVARPGDLRLTLRLNGQIMQDSSTADMMFDVPHLIAYLSRSIQILPGDLLLTGSPPGNGIQHGRLLTPGDVIEAEITGLGIQRNRIIQRTW